MCEDARSAASVEVFGISVLVSDSDCDKQPSYEYCIEGTEWLQNHYSVLVLIWLATYDIYKKLLVS